MKLLILLTAANAAALIAQTLPSEMASPNSLLFAQTLNGTPPGPQTVKISATAAGVANFTATATPAWLSVSAASGSLPASLNVSVNATGLAIGTNSGTLAVSFPGTNDAPLTIQVTYVLTSAPALVATASMIAMGQGGMPGTGGPVGGGPPAGGMPGTLAIGSSFLVASTAGTSPFAAAISNTCTNAFTVTPLTGTTPATITVTGDPTALSNGTNCSAIVTLTSTGLTSATVNVTAAAPGGGMLPTGSVAVPTVAKLVNAASYAEGTIAPGEIVTLFGTNLGLTALTSGTFANGQQSTTVAGLQVAFGGTAAPILYARTDQMSVIVPFEVGTGLINMQILVNGTAMANMQVPVVSAAPAIFTTASSGSGQGAIINQDGTINATSNAAVRGSVIAIYMTGGGAVTPAGQSGALASTTQLQPIADRVGITIAGQTAAVTFAGAVPGSLFGLYQVNATVPSSVAAGTAPVLVSIGGATSPTGVTVAVK